MKPSILIILCAVLGLMCCLSLTLGKYPVGIGDMAAFFLYKTAGAGPMGVADAELMENLLFDIRLPRILAAMLIGAALSTSGASFQALFTNPLVSPKMLGVLSGASFGAVSAMLFTRSWFVVQASAAAFGFIAVGAAIGIARLYRTDSIIMLVLGGIISEALFTSLISIVKYVADPYDDLPAITYWLMGNLSFVNLRTVTIAGVPILAGVFALMLYGKHLNVLSLGDEEAHSLGVNIRVIRYGIIFFATLASTLTVVIGGMVGWVGLIIPHVARMLVGPNNIILLPASALLGAIYLLLADGLSRLLFSFEIPIGIVTSLFGIPFFLYILRNAKKGWS
ncbi:MAG: FecCD family ABC transporter permease [Desulfomonilia bacterium]|uniref:ABC transporter permease n=1 Tax=anaerobic digester metagenome TaxID=1263854 RepID=A0A485M1U7_9ZZZZ|nr:iron ABC transporter permease [Pseudomonadota bacterium]HRR22266.1 iron ABC transporter permease [Desulfomonilia bacterium]HRR70190.1 iron ABC transporter permease [Desulfomonilia bacterium]